MLRQIFTILILASVVLVPQSTLSAQIEPSGGGGLIDYLATMPVEPLSPSEADVILMMREEEKFARDVYITLNSLYPNSLFTTIAAYEQDHMDALEFLVRRYGLIDTITDRTVGAFKSPRLEEMYTSLITVAGWSYNHALLVGNIVEEHDLYDLDIAIAQSDSADVLTVFQNLQKDSRNHLRLSHLNLRLRGWLYYPLFMELSPFVEILLTPLEFGLVDQNGELL